MARKKAAGAPATAIVVSSDEVEKLSSLPKRSMRKRKEVSYKERRENDSDIAEEKPKKRVKAAAKSTVTTTQAASKKGKAKATKPEVAVVDDEESEEEKPKPKPAPKKRGKVRDDVMEYDGDGEEIRKRDYEDEPSDKFLGNKSRALLQPLQFIDRQRCDTPEAPRETFTIAGNSGKDYTVNIRHVPTCSCFDFTVRRTPCKHMIYTMVKVLKVSEDSPLLYQYALTSVELQSIFNNAPAAPHIEVVEEADDPKRKPIEGECPICYMEFEPGKESITYCKAHCGNNVHRDCMATWLRSQRQMYGKGTCPYCRQHWLE